MCPSTYRIVECAAADGSQNDIAMARGLRDRQYVPAEINQWCRIDVDAPYVMLAIAICTSPSGRRIFPVLKHIIIIAINQ